MLECRLSFPKQRVLENSDTTGLRYISLQIYSCAKQTDGAIELSGWGLGFNAAGMLHEPASSAAVESVRIKWQRRFKVFKQGAHTQGKVNCVPVPTSKRNSMIKLSTCLHTQSTVNLPDSGAISRLGGWWRRYHPGH